MIPTYDIRRIRLIAVCDGPYSAAISHRGRKNRVKSRKSYQEHTIPENNISGISSLVVSRFSTVLGLGTTRTTYARLSVARFYAFKKGKRCKKILIAKSDLMIEVYAMLSGELRLINFWRCFMIILLKNDEEKNRLELTAMTGVTFNLTTGKISVYLVCSIRR